MHETTGLTLILTHHARKVAEDKGFPLNQIHQTFDRPRRVYRSRSHPGQHRVTGHGLCLVGRKCGDKFVVMTIYLDEVLTPPRPDQLATAEGQDYAERYSNGSRRR